MKRMISTRRLDYGCVITVITIESQANETKKRFFE